MPSEHSAVLHVPDRPQLPVPMSVIYLDHTATTPLDPRVLEAMLPYLTEKYGNASSIHSFGREGRTAIEKARKIIAESVGASPAEIIFTSGGTESNNAAIRGTLEGSGGSRKHLMTAAAEHHSVLEVCEHLRETAVCEVTVLPVDEHALVPLSALGKEIGPSTFLVSLMLANNEVGSIPSLPEVAEYCRANGALLHTDAVQAFGKIPVSVDELQVDLMTISAHKIYGPKGIGALYVRRGTKFDPLMHGGGQERGRRPGTENVPAIVGFGKAAEIALAGMNEESALLRGMRDDLQKAVCLNFPGVIVNGHPQSRLPHILNISFDSRRVRLEGEMLPVNLDLAGISLTSGSACTSGSMQPSHVILAMGRDRETANATLRFAFGRSNRPEEIDLIVTALRNAVEKARRDS